MFRSIVMSMIAFLSCPALFAEATNDIAPGAPGLDAHWPSAAKNGFGTANTLASKVWFTLNNGVMTEVYYPTLDVPNVQTLQFLIVAGGRLEVWQGNVRSARNRRAYGERADGGDYDGRSGVGRLWTLLTGERGEYEIARGDLAAARKRLDTMMSFANDGMMIPEQVRDRNQSPRPELRFGEGTGSATPLAWSMAQFIRLAVNLERGRNVETPALTEARNRKGLVNN